MKNNEQTLWITPFICYAIFVACLLLMCGCGLNESIHTDRPTGESIAKTIDAVGPSVLRTVGLISGIPVFGAIAALWSRKKLANRTRDIILSVQDGRNKLRGEHPEMLRRFDKALSVQKKETISYVKGIKKKSYKLLDRPI